LQNKVKKDYIGFSGRFTRGNTRRQNLELTQASAWRIMEQRATAVKSGSGAGQIGHLF
jgi:hypothetical protein